MGRLLGVLYLIAFVAGFMKIRNGRLVLSIIGFVFPLLWIIGAFVDSLAGRRPSDPVSHEIRSIG